MRTVTTCDDTAVVVVLIDNYLNMSKPVHGTESLGSLIGTTSALSKSDQDMRLDDYLNDKIQTTSDFKGLASLLASVEGQRKDLEEQVG